MYGPNMKPIFIAIGILLGFVLWSGFAVDVYGGGVVMDRDTLMNQARKIAAEHKVDVDSCTVHLTRQDEDIVVEFWPYNTNQLGGGARLFFKEKNNVYEFRRIELWQ